VSPSRLGAGALFLPLPSHRNCIKGYVFMPERKVSFEITSLDREGELWLASNGNLWPAWWGISVRGSVEEEKR
jgi:hypothetical protein